MWDVTIGDILADSYLASTLMTAVAAAELAATRKRFNYVELTTTQYFDPLAFESLGFIGSKATIFFKRTRSSLNTRTLKHYENCVFVPVPVCSIAAL